MAYGPSDDAHPSVVEARIFSISSRPVERGAPSRTRELRRLSPSGLWRLGDEPERPSFRPAIPHTGFVAAEMCGLA